MRERKWRIPKLLWVLKQNTVALGVISIMYLLNGVKQRFKRIAVKYNADCGCGDRKTANLGMEERVRELALVETGRGSVKRFLWTEQRRRQISGINLFFSFFLFFFLLLILNVQTTLKA